MADKVPTVPQYQNVAPQPINYPDWAYFGEGFNAPDPWDYYRMQNAITKGGLAMYPTLVQSQLNMMPQITAAQIAASEQAFPTALSQQQRASQAAFEEQMRQYGIAAPQIASQNVALQQQYAPQYANLLRQQGQLTADQLQRQAQQYDPQFFQTYGALGGRINEGLAAGYSLGPGLTTEVQQAIRGGQTARGNWLGPAPTAQEAFGTGQAAIDLYNQRLSASQNFVSGRAPTDLWGGMMGQYGPAGTAMGMVGQTGMPQIGLNAPIVSQTAGPMAAQGAAAGYQPPNINYPAQAAAQYGTYSQALGQYGATSVAGQSDYNSALINAANINNQGMFMQYDKSWDQYMYDQAVQHGMYSTPSTGGSGAMQMAGQIGGSVVGAAGAIGAAAAAGGAAICWLARLVIPERWLEWREFLLTEAPESLRRAYLFGAKRMSMEISEEKTKEIATIMERCLA